MRRVTIKQFKYEPDLKTFVGHVDAVIELDADGLRDVQGQTFYAEIPAKDLAGGRTLKLQDDPIRWSELIAATVTYGDIEVVVEDVSTDATKRTEPEPATVAIEALAAQIHGQ